MEGIACYDWKYNGGYMYEHHRQPLASQKVFLQRLTNNGLIAIALLTISLGLGILG